MSTSLLEQLTLSRIRGAREAVHLVPALSDLDREDAVGELLEYPKLLRRLADRAWARAFGGETISLEEAEEARSHVAAVYDEAIILMRSLTSALPSRSELAIAMHEVEQDLASFLERWEPIRIDDLTTEGAEGWLEPLEAFAQARGVGVEEARKRLVEHQSRRAALGWE